MTSPSCPVVRSVPPFFSDPVCVTAVHSMYSVLPPIEVHARPVTTPGGVTS